MLRRFVSAIAVAAPLIALASAVVSLLPLPTAPLQLALHIWCAVPLAWGLWALLAPASWVSRRLPLWGAFLGLIAAVLAGFVLGMPSRVLGRPAPWASWLALVVGPLAYYLLWMIVRAVYERLGRAPAEAQRNIRPVA